MKHKFIKGKGNGNTLVLFHGTGGTEEDLIPLAQIIDPNADILSIRGNVSENGMNRFFRRLSEGVFDEEDIRIRAQEIADFLDQAALEYGLKKENFVGVGYSNGANIIAAMHYIYGGIFSKSILFHPMVPLKDELKTDLSGVEIFIGAGENDPIVPFENTTNLEHSLKENGAEVSMYKYTEGHSLTSDEVHDAGLWYSKI